MREASTGLLVEVDPASNVTDLLLEQDAANPAHALYRRKGPNGWVDVPVSRFVHDVKALAKGLIAGGLEPGDSVGVMAATSYQWTLVDFAIWFAGGVTVPLRPTSRPSELEWVLADSGARRVFAENRTTARLLTGVLAGSVSLRDRLVNVVRMEDDGVAPNLASLAAAGAGVSDAELERHRSRAGLSDVAALHYTYGSTLEPKGCELTHGNFALVATNMVAFLPELLLQEQARSLMYLPMDHVLARSVQVVCLAAGATLGHTAGPDKLTADLGTFRPTFLPVTPRLLEQARAASAQTAAMAGKARLFSAASRAAVRYSGEQELAGRGEGEGANVLSRARHAVFDRLVYARLRQDFGGELAYAVSGGGLPVAEATHFFRAAGVAVLAGFGLAQTTSLCTVNTPAHTKVGSVGIPIPGTTIRVAEDGEVLVKGIGVFRGYRGDRVADAAAFTDGFYRTGYLGGLDQEGYLTISGRRVP